MTKKSSSDWTPWLATVNLRRPMVQFADKSVTDSWLIMMGRPKFLIRKNQVTIIFCFYWQMNYLRKFKLCPQHPSRLSRILQCFLISPWNWTAEVKTLEHFMSGSTNGPLRVKIMDHHRAGRWANTPKNSGLAPGCRQAEFFSGFFYRRKIP